MQVLNLTNVEKSDIKYTISRFPDGEVQITLGEFCRKDDIEVRCRITSSDDLFILMQVADILNRHEVIWVLNIYYLMGMRMDRVMDFNRPFTLKIIQNVLSSLGASRIGFFEPHSRRCYEPDKMFGFVEPDGSGEERICDFSPCLPETREKFQIVLPDKGAVEREFPHGAPEDVIVAEKVRDIKTGQIQSIRIVNPDKLNDTKPILVVDDLCDGGGTFCGIAEEIRKIKPNAKLEIFVTHMVNAKGISNLAKTFDHVYFTNSYCDWESGYKANGLKFPKNITQFNIV